MQPSSYKDITTSRGFKYHYYRHSVQGGSSKPVVLLLHGFPNSSHDWRKVVPAFERRGYDLIVPDMLGYGGTDKPTDTEAYKMSGLCRDVVDILDAEGAEKVVVIGHDWCVLMLLCLDRKRTRLNSSHSGESRMPSSA